MNKMMITIDYDIDMFYIFKELILKPFLKLKINKYIVVILFFISFFITGVKNDKNEFLVSYKIVKKQYYWMSEGLYNTIYFKSLKYKLNPLLVSSLINAESGGYKYAVSSAGAKGYMQLMDFHTEGVDPFDTDININRGSKYLWKCKHKSRHNLYEALRKYNQGINGNRKKYNNWKYVRKILRHYKILILREGGYI